MFVRFLIGVACVLLVADTSMGEQVETKSEQVYLEFAELFRASIRSNYQTDAHFVEAYKAFESSHKGPSLLDQPTTSELKHFILKLRDNCVNCHEKMKAKVTTANQYKTLDKTHALIFCSEAEMNDLQAQLPEALAHHAIMLPSLKIDSRLTDFINNDCQKIVQSIPQIPSTFSHPAAEEMSKLLRGSLKDSLEATKQEDLMVKVLISPMSHESELDSFRSFLSELSTSYDSNVMNVKFDNSQAFNERMIAVVTIKSCTQALEVINKLSVRNEVQWLERMYPMHTHNRWARGVCDSGDYRSTPLIHVGDDGITGEGEVVGIADSGLDMSSCYFNDVTVPFNYQTALGPTVLNPTHRKVIQYIAYADNEDDDGHGTHVSGTVAGNTVDSEEATSYNGMSPDSKIAFFDIGQSGDPNLDAPLNLETGLFNKLYASGARVFTNSWGSDSNEYDSYAADVDSFMANNPDAIVLFSAGNTGDAGPSSVHSPSTNKNGICVGASSNDRIAWKEVYGLDKSYLDTDSVAHFSSEGPTADSRMKPDLLAPGYITVSAYISGSTGYHCDVAPLQGTSMAAPTAAGYAVKVRQYFTKGFYPSGTQTVSDQFTPSGALIKAVMVHSGQVMARVANANSTVTPVGTYPNNIQGYGRIQMSEVLNFGESTVSPLTMFVVGAADSTDSHYAEVTTGVPSVVFNFQTNADTTQHDIRITLAYTDVPGTPGGISVMRNMLTITATDNNGNTFTPYLASGMIASNLQMIDIDNVQPSRTYTVTVTGTTLLTASQSFAMVVTGATTYLPLQDDYYEGKSNNKDGFDTPFGVLSWYAIIIIVVLACCLCCMVEGCARQCRNKKEPNAAAVARHERHNQGGGQVQTASAPAQARV